MHIDGVADLAAQARDALHHRGPLDHPHRVAGQFELRMDGMAAAALHKHLLVDVDRLGEGKAGGIMGRHGELGDNDVIVAVLKPGDGLLERHHGVKLHRAAGLG